MRISRVMILIVFPITTLAFIAATFFLGSQGLLPDPVAVHWGPSGQADGFMSLAAYLWLIGIGFGLLWAGLLALELVPIRARLLRPLLKGFTGYLYGFILALMVLTTLLQIGRDANQPSNVGLWILLTFVPVGFLIWLILGKPSVSLEDSLEIRLRGVRVVSIPGKDVVAITLGDLKGREFGGWGLRYASKTLAFIPNSGPAVFFDLSWGERIAVRSDDAAELAKTMQRK